MTANAERREWMIRGAEAALKDRDKSGGPDAGWDKLRRISAVRIVDALLAKEAR